MAQDSMLKSQQRLDELADLLRDAHDQLYQRDRTLVLLAANRSPRARITADGSLDRLAASQLRAELAEQTIWAQRSAQEVLERDAIIRELQSALEQQAAWALASAREVAVRDEHIKQLQGELADPRLMLKRFLPLLRAALLTLRLHRHALTDLAARRFAKRSDQSPGTNAASKDP